MKNKNNRGQTNPHTYLEKKITNFLKTAKPHNRMIETRRNTGNGFF
jgi:hypothetical protein